MAENNLKMNPALVPFFTTKANFYILYGGRMSSKTFSLAAFLVYLASQYKLKILCARSFQNKLSESVKSTIEECIELAGLQKEFHITENAIVHKRTKSSFSFVGIKRNINEIKGMSGIDIAWLEESEGLTEEEWNLIVPTIMRKEGAIIFVVFNPRLKTDFVWKHFVVNTQPNTIVRKINYDENPFLSNTAREIIEAKKGSPDFDHIYLGEPMDTDENSIIKRSHILAAVDAHKKLGIEILGSNTLGFDVADDGGDGCALIQTFGNCVVWADQWKAKEDELLKSCTRTWNEARNRNASVVYDAIGVGAFVGGKLNDINDSSKSGTKITYKKYFSGGAVLHPDRDYLDTKVKNKHFFSNRKAQSWWSAADRLRNTYNAVMHGEKFDADEMIFIDGSIPYLNALIDELCTPNKDFDASGRVKVEGKKELKKRGVDSPNLADAFIMALDKTATQSDGFSMNHFWKR